MKKKSSYYTEGFQRKLFGLIYSMGKSSQAIQDEFRSLIEEAKVEINLQFQEESIGTRHLNDEFVSSLHFEEDVATKKVGGEKNPLIPALYALKLYQNIEANKENFVAQADYIKSLAKTKHQETYWEYENGVERFNIEAPWVSGISQAMIASVMIRMYLLKKEESHLQLAKGAIDYCLNDVNGLYTDLGNDLFWIEEYPKSPGLGVLNGFIYFVISLGELACFLDEYKTIFEAAVKSLLSKLPDYHKGQYLSYGAELHDLSNPEYQSIHYWQLEHLQKLTGVELFRKLKEKWLEVSKLKLG